MMLMYIFYLGCPGKSVFENSKHPKKSGAEGGCQGLTSLRPLQNQMKTSLSFSLSPARGRKLREGPTDEDMVEWSII